MSENKRETGVLYMRGFPRHLKAMFKAACYRRGSDMKTVIKDMMLDYVREDYVPPVRRKK